MNRKELIDWTCDTLRAQGVGKPVTVPRRTFCITDNDGNECKFHVRQKDKTVGYTQQDAAAIIDTFLKGIEQALRRGEPVSVYGFGNLEPHFRRERSTPVFGSEERISIPGHHVVKFSPGKNLRMAMKLLDVEKEERGET